MVKLSLDKINEIKRLYVDEGLPTGKVAKICGVERHTVSRNIKKLDITLRKRMRPNYENPLIECACGCGQLRNQYELREYNSGVRYDRPYYLIQGHWKKGKKHIEIYGEKKSKEISDKSLAKRRKTYEEHPEILVLHGQQMSKIFRENPQIMKRASEKRAKTLKDNPEIIKKSHETLKSTHKNHPEILINSVKKRKETYKNHPELLKNLSEIKKKQYRDNPKLAENLSLLQKKLWQDEEYRKKQIQSMNIPKVVERRKEIRAKQVLPKKDTKIEIKIQEFLKYLGIEFFTHQYIKEIKHGYQCDIFIPSLNMIIECDGIYWHKYPIGTKLDKIRTKELIKKGFKVLRLWEFDINKMNIEEFKERINNL